MTTHRVTILKRVVRFGIVGGVSFLVYLACMWFVVDRLGQNATLAAACAFCVATIVSYIGNTLWSFEAPIRGATAVRFLVIVLLGLVANIVIAWALQRIGLGYVVISVIVFVTVPILNFLGHQFWTYRVATPAVETEQNA